jgi:hypothetical protein
LLDEFYDGLITLSNKENAVGRGLPSRPGCFARGAPKPSLFLLIGQCPASWRVVKENAVGRGPAQQTWMLR